ncbi:hypothetical protein AVEN_174089-1 [Araneus ventricosus]|uniref:Uncharacterized protein n=1 Tax=Araneus ventricosus TaxID=182803 RepID=A0A4Y2C4P7_ARAVE|nr:hypothetical protein AVEN_174089-1 [Araneus ventricosus]
MSHTSNGDAHGDDDDHDDGDVHDDDHDVRHDDDRDDGHDGDHGDGHGAHDDDDRDVHDDGDHDDHARRVKASEGSGDLVARCRLQGRRVPGSKPHSTEDPSCIGPVARCIIRRGQTSWCGAEAWKRGVSSGIVPVI